MKKNRVISLLLMICLMITACGSTSAETVTDAANIRVSSTPTMMPFSTSTLTPLPPVVMVNKMADCYGGPGGAGYQLVATFEGGEQLDVVGKNESDQYWIVIDPKSNKGCWIESQYTTMHGTAETLPVLLPAPTMALRPNAPEAIDVEIKCSKGGTVRLSSFTLTILITWTDTSDNETGFEIYKNGNLWQTLDANVTQIYEELSSEHVITGAATYTILAFNDTGNSTRVEKTVTYHCP